MRRDISRAPGLIERWLAKLKARNERARAISRKGARREHSEHHPGHGGDGPGIGGGF